MTTSDFIREFKTPSATHRSQILWVWNGAMTRARVTTMLGDLAEAGFGGVFVHPRPGLITEYLSAEWFDLWRHALAESRRLGLECHIYDENTYPAGFGGGHVVAANPLAVARRLTLTYWPRGARKPEEMRGAVYRGALKQGPGGAADAPLGAGESWAQAIEETGLFAIEVNPEPSRLWTAGFPWVDLTRPGAGAEFIASTHQRYAEEVGEGFGREIGYVFSDEPHLTLERGWLVSETIAAQMREDYGTDLWARIADLFLEGPTSAETRFAYHATLMKLFARNFLRPMREWCEAHGLRFTGHFMEHSWPAPLHAPSYMAALRWMHVPGIDLLAFQFTPHSYAESAHWLLTIKEVTSVANQTAAPRVLCEAYGAGGHDFALPDFKPLADFLFAGGINLLSPHLNSQTNVGGRKYDWPQVIGAQSAWFRSYRTLADHEGRSCALLTRGREVNRVLVLQPTATAWLHYVSATYSPLNLKGDAVIDALRVEQGRLLQALTRAGVDYDVGDECLIAELGKMTDGKLQVGARTYDAVVTPATWEVCFGSTWRLLEAFIDAGGTVLALGAAPVRVDGRLDPAPGRFVSQHASRWLACGSMSDLLAQLRQVVPPRLEIVEATPDQPGLSWHRREWGDGEILYFLANPFRQALRARVRVEGASVSLWDTGTGEILPVDQLTPAAKGGVWLDLTLAPGAHRVLVTSAAAAQPWLPRSSQPARTGSVREVALDGWRVSRCADNVLVLPFAGLKTGAVTMPENLTTRINQRLWEEAGFPQDIWTWTIQYRDAFLRAPVRSGLSFAVTYRFDVAADLSPTDRAALALGVEQPERYEISVNGVAINRQAATPLWDENLWRLPIGAHLQIGPNAIVLAARQFEVRHEIAPAYVLGRFDLRNATRGFVLGAARTPSFGPWRDQGAPFYSGPVAHVTEFTLAQPASRLQVDLPGAVISSARIWVDDGAPVDAIFAPFQATIDGAFAAGPHALRIEVTGSVQNLYGPFFAEGFATPRLWFEGPTDPVPGAHYKFKATGLSQPPTLKALQP